MQPIGRLGIWTDQFDGRPIGEVRDAAAMIDELGYGALWVPETVGREAMAQAAVLLAATRRIVVANGVASIYARDAVTAAAGHRTLREAYPGRTVLGLGVSHPSIVRELRGHEFGPPVATMRAYLDVMDTVEPGTDRVLAAIGPRMLALAADRASGALPLGMPVGHTARAREILGPQGFLAVVQIVATDAEAAAALVPELLPNRAQTLAALGYRDADLADALIVHGGPDRVAERVAQHIAAGADHVALHVVDSGLPIRQWQELAG